MIRGTDTAHTLATVGVERIDQRIDAAACHAITPYASGNGSAIRIRMFANRHCCAGTDLTECNDLKCIYSRLISRVLSKYLVDSVNALDWRRPFQLPQNTTVIISLGQLYPPRPEPRRGATAGQRPVAQPRDSDRVRQLQKPPRYRYKTSTPRDLIPLTALIRQIGRDNGTADLLCLWLRLD